MKKWVLIAVVYVIPKVQPIFPGMIVRCDQPETPGLIFSPDRPRPPALCPEDRCACRWECEYGMATETYVEDGNQKARAAGCNPKTEALRCPSGNNFWGITPTMTIPAGGSGYNGL